MLEIPEGDRYVQVRTIVCVAFSPRGSKVAFQTEGGPHFRVMKVLREGDEIRLEPSVDPDTSTPEVRSLSQLFGWRLIARRSVLHAMEQFVASGTWEHSAALEEELTTGRYELPSWSLAVERFGHFWLEGLSPADVAVVMNSVSLFFHVLNTIGMSPAESEAAEGVYDHGALLDVTQRFQGDTELRALGVELQRNIDLSIDHQDQREVVRRIYARVSARKGRGHTTFSGTLCVHGCFPVLWKVGLFVEELYREAEEAEDENVLAAAENFLSLYEQGLLKVLRCYAEFASALVEFVSRAEIQEAIASSSAVWAERLTFEEKVPEGMGFEVLCEPFLEEFARQTGQKTEETSEEVSEPPPGAHPISCGRE